MSRKCYIVLSMHHDNRTSSPRIEAGTSDVFESIIDGNNALAVQLSAAENRLRGGQADICPDGSRDRIIDYESTVGQRSEPLWSARITTSLHQYYWKNCNISASRHGSKISRKWGPADRFVKVLATGSGPPTQVNGFHSPAPTQINGFHSPALTQVSGFYDPDPAQVNGFYYLDPAQINGFGAQTAIDGYT